jgi:hypothetical protein
VLILWPSRRLICLSHFGQPWSAFPARGPVNWDPSRIRSGVHSPYPVTCAATRPVRRPGRRTCRFRCSRLGWCARSQGTTAGDADHRQPLAGERAGSHKRDPGRWGSTPAAEGAIDPRERAQTKRDEGRALKRRQTAGVCLEGAAEAHRSAITWARFRFWTDDRTGGPFAYCQPGWPDSRGTNGDRNSPCDERYRCATR